MVSGAGAHCRRLCRRLAARCRSRRRIGACLSQFVSGWYMRGDLGYRFQHVGEAHESAQPTRARRPSDAYMAGGGFGYKWIGCALDMTGDYGGRGHPRCVNGVRRANSFTAKIETYSRHVQCLCRSRHLVGHYALHRCRRRRRAVSTLDYTYPSPPSLLPRCRRPTAMEFRLGPPWRASATNVVERPVARSSDIAHRYGRCRGGPKPFGLSTKDLTGDEIRIGSALHYRIAAIFPHGLCGRRRLPI